MKKACTKRDYIVVGLCSILLCLIRKNGAYTILLIFLIAAVIFVINKGKKTGNGVGARAFVFSSILLIGVVFEMIFSSILAANGVEKGPFRESLSVPLQQTARLSRDYSEIVSDEDRSIINKVIDFEYIGEAYSPKCSDAVKDTYYGESMGDFIAYLRIWTKYLVKAPSIYIQAFLHMNGDFLDVNAHFIELTKLDTEVTDRFKPWPIEGWFRIFTDFYEGFPLIWPVCNVGIQSWFSIYMLLMAIDKKSKSLFLLTIPAVATVFICLLGPTFSNQGIRYLIPAMFVNPFVINIVIDRFKEERKCEEG